MYAVAFDLVVADTEKHHPKGVTQAYTDIGVFRAVSTSARTRIWRTCFLRFKLLRW